MTIVRFSALTSLDGFLAGPNQSEENPFGEGGMALHEWLFPLEAWRRSHGLEGGELNATTAVAEELEFAFGAVVVSRAAAARRRGTCCSGVFANGRRSWSRARRSRRLASLT